MARLDFKLPDVGEGVTEGEIVQWFVAVGDTVAEDDPMVEVMTDKATVTIGAPCEARVERLCFEVGAVARVGQVILTLESELSSNVDAPRRSSRPPATAVGKIRDQVPGAGLFQVGAGAETAYFDAKPLATPATRRLADELGVDLRRVRPGGADGRVTADDLRALVAEEQTDTRLEERRPIVGMRRTIAERMHRSKTTAAHFTFVEECDASGLVELRRQLLPEAERRGLRLTYLPFIVKAVADALPRHPVLNAAVDERSNELVYKKYYNIGVATATEAGLMVPVVHDADRLSLFELGEPNRKPCTVGEGRNDCAKRSAGLHVHGYILGQTGWPSSNAHLESSGARHLGGPPNQGEARGSRRRNCRRQGHAALTLARSSRRRRTRWRCVCV